MITTHFREIRQILILSALVESFKTIREFYGNNDGFIRVKCRLVDASTLEFSEYARIESGRIFLITYSYHWQTAKEALIKRWDNAPHHPEIATFPHHLHDLTDVVTSKPMTLKLVLDEIGKHMRR